MPVLRQRVFDYSRRRYDQRAVLHRDMERAMKAKLSFFGGGNHWWWELELLGVTITQRAPPYWKQGDAKRGALLWLKKHMPHVEIEEE